EPGALLRALEIEADAALAAIEQRKRHAFAGHMWAVGAHLLAFGSLDLDDLGAGFRQHERRQRPRQQRGEVEDHQPRQRLKCDGWEVMPRVFASINAVA